MPDKEEKIIDLPSDGPDTEVTLPEETVKEGAQDVAVPEKKPEGEVEVTEEKKEESPKELIQEETTKEETPKQEYRIRMSIAKELKKEYAKLTKRNA